MLNTSHYGSILHMAPDVVSDDGLFDVKLIRATARVLYPLVFTSSTAVKPVTLGVVTDLIRGDLFFWGSLMAGALLAGLPVAILFNYFLDDFVEGITAGSTK